MRTKAWARLLGVTVAAGAAGVVALSALGAVRSTTATVGRSADTIPGIVDVYTNLGYQNAAAAGTGIVLTSSGEILTNNHVIRGSTSVRVTDLDTGHKYPAKVVGYSLNNDVAILQLQGASNLQTAAIGNSGGAKVGASVTTYGNAGGVGGAPSVSTGTITGIGRAITVSDDQGGSEHLTGLIETDAGLQPGDSGGPMVDASGKVIGLDTAASSSFSFSTNGTRGYAIPIDHAKALAAQIVAGQASTTVHIGATAFMGLSVQSQNDFFGSSGHGLVIANVVPGSPTEKVGLTAGDTLTTFDGKAVNTPANLTALVVTKSPGDIVAVHWLDQAGSAHTGSMKLVSGPPQ